MQQCNTCDEDLHKQEVCRLNSDGEGSEAQHCGVGGDGMGGASGAGHYDWES